MHICFYFNSAAIFLKLSCEGWFYHVNTGLIITSKGDGFGLCLGTVPEKYIKKIKQLEKKPLWFQSIPLDNWTIWYRVHSP